MAWDLLSFFWDLLKTPGTFSNYHQIMVTLVNILLLFVDFWLLFSFKFQLQFLTNFHTFWPRFATFGTIGQFLVNWINILYNLAFFGQLLVIFATCHPTISSASHIFILELTNLFEKHLHEVDMWRCVFLVGEQPLLKRFCCQCEDGVSF